MPKSLTIWFLTGVWILCEYQIQANNRYVYESDTDLDVAAPGLALRDGQHQQHEHHLRHHRQSSKTMWSILDQTVKSNEIADNKRQKELQQHQQQHMQHKKERKVQSNCPKCKNELRINEQELTELRIAYVKKQILKKLKLKERPQVSVSHIPRPVAEGATIQLDDSDDIQSRVSEEFYARTTQKIIFPQLGMYTSVNYNCISCAGVLRNYSIHILIDLIKWKTILYAKSLVAIYSFNTISLSMSQRTAATIFAHTRTIPILPLWKSECNNLIKNLVWPSLLSSRPP